MSRLLRTSAALAATLVVGTGVVGCSSGTPSASPTPSTSPTVPTVLFEPDAAAATLGDPASVVLLKLGPTGLYLVNPADPILVQMDYTAGGAPRATDMIDGDVSWDGTQVVFDSFASDVVSGDTNGVLDIFIKDVASGTVVRLSDGPVSNWDVGSWQPRISADGTTVVFTSYVLGLVSGVEIAPQVYLYSVPAGELSVVGVAPGSDPPLASDPSISAGGRYVAYSSILQGDYGDAGYLDAVFVFDTSTGKEELVSVAADGTPGNLASSDPSISLDGRYVAFQSKATNLTGEDTGMTYDVFVRDRATGETLLISANEAGSPANGDSINPKMVGDGSGVVFSSEASDLVSGDTNGFSDIFYSDLTTGSVRRLNVGPGGIEADGDSFVDAIYGARYVVITTYATNLGGAASDSPMSFYVFDLETLTLAKLL